MCGLICYLILAGILYALYLYLPKLWLQRKLDRFEKSKCPKDIVILHGTPRTSQVPAASPFVLKLETFLRMAKIPYQYDGKPENTFGPKGKTPWITLNGEHIADSEICIEFLIKKFGNPIKNNYDEKQKSIANLVQIMFEDRIFWSIALWAFVWEGEGPKVTKKFLRLPWIFTKIMGYVYNKNAYAHGIGRHSQDVIEAWTLKAVSSIGTVLGDNKFLLGDEPCIEDATTFGFMAQLFWGFPQYSPYAKFIKEKYPNVEAYCKRMRQLYFEDWDELLLKKKSS